MKIFLAKIEKKRVLLIQVPKKLKKSQKNVKNRKNRKNALLSVSLAKKGHFSKSTACERRSKKHENLARS